MGGTPNGVVVKWTRDLALNAAAEWFAAYGSPPRAADLQPSRLLRAGDAEAMIRRQSVRLPPKSAIDRLFGSVSSWLAAAGYEPRRVGRPVGTGIVGPRAPQINGWAQKKWREAVLARDSYRCQDCGSEDDLESHHLIPTRKAFALWTEIDNGVTVCHACHQQRHRTLREAAG